MTQNVSELAERLMQLWQQQLQAMMQDGDFMKHCFDALQGMGNYGNMPGYEPRTHDKSAAPDAVVYELRQLKSRVERLESQLAERDAKTARTATAASPAKRAAGARKKTPSSLKRKS